MAASRPAEGRRILASPSLPVADPRSTTTATSAPLRERRRPVDRPAPLRLLPGDEDLAEGAVGEQFESFVCAVQGDACLDVDVELSAGDELKEPRELVRGGGRQDPGDPDVVAAELLGVASSVDATVPPARIT
jgi:hypothetical protein